MFHLGLIARPQEIYNKNSKAGRNIYQEITRGSHKNSKAGRHKASKTSCLENARSETQKYTNSIAPEQSRSKGKT